MVLIRQGRIYRDGTFEAIFGNVHQQEVYHLLLARSSETVLEARFPGLAYEVSDEGLVLETRDQVVYQTLLKETEVLQFSREPVSLEDLLYEVLK